MSARFFTACVPARRLASCQTTQRWIRSGRGSSPKMASLSFTEPASLPSSVVTLISMSLTRLRRFGGGFGLVGLRLTLGRRGFGRRLELAGLRQVLGRRLLHRVAHGDPAALVTGHRAFEHDQATLDVGLHDTEIERGDAVDAEMTRHLLVL